MNAQILKLVHSSIYELNGILMKGYKWYFIISIDYYFRYTQVYLMRSKDEAFEFFKCYKIEVENQKEKKIKIFYSDNNGEYFSDKFVTYCEEHGIIHQKSLLYTPQQNSLVVQLKEKI